MFITLTMVEKGSRWRAAAPSGPQKKPFMSWRVGDAIKKKKSTKDRTVWRIERIDGAVEVNMGYKSRVAIRSADGEWEKELTGGTLQSTYEHFPEPDAIAPPPPKPEGRPVCFNVDHIRNFYPRKGQPGTRIMTSNGVPYAVHELFEEVQQMVTALRARMPEPRQDDQ